MATYYISPTGDDGTGDGSEGNPWATIEHAYENSANGDTINIAAGTYTWSTYEFLGATYGDRTLVGDDAETTIFDAGSSVVYWRFDSADFTFRNLTWRNNLQNDSFIPIFGMRNNSFIMTVSFESCRFHDIELSDENDATVGGLLSTNLEGAFQGTNKTISVASCVIYDIRRHSAASQGTLFTDRGGGLVNTFDVQNTTIYLTDPNMTYIFASNLKDDGMIESHNNIIANFSGGTINYKHRSGTPVESHNCHYLITGAPSGTGNITADPLFVDGPNRDFRLRQDSPCLDAGVVL